MDIFHDRDIRADIDIVTDNGGVLLVAADAGELRKITVVADDGGRMNDDRTGMRDIQTVADPGIAQDLDLILGPVDSPEEQSQIS